MPAPVDPRPPRAFAAGFFVFAALLLAAGEPAVLRADSAAPAAASAQATASAPATPSSAASAPAATAATAAPAPAEPRGGGTPEAIIALRDLVTEQRAALALAKAAPDAAAAEDYRPRLQKVADRYEELLKRFPDFAAGWASYGLFLSDPLIDERRTALALLLKANNLDPEIPLVKNQIGVFMAEEGRVIDAFNYFLAASDLAPDEPLYHFQLGLLIDEGRDAFLKTKAWKRPDLDKSMLAAFARAVELAPERTDFAYRAAEAYYGLEEPRWEEAYHRWSMLESRLQGRLETQTVRLHRARTRWKQGFAGDARELLASVDAPELAAQKAKLAAEFAADDAAEAAQAAGAPPPPAAPESDAAVRFTPPPPPPAPAK